MAQNGTCKYFCLYSNYSNNDNDYMRKMMMKAKEEKYHKISVTICSFQIIQYMNRLLIIPCYAHPHTHMHTHSPLSLSLSQNEGGNIKKRT